MSFRRLMNSRATVFAITATSDAYGTSTESSDARYSNMPCRLQPIKGTEDYAYYGAGRTEVTHRLYYPGGFSALAERDKVKIGSTIYQVLFVANPDLSSHHFEAELRELREPVT